MAPKQSMLIVDDSLIGRELLHTIFRPQFEILEASNGREALDLLKHCEDNITVVLLDLVMPETDGFDVLRQLRHNGQMTALPTVVITATEDAAILEKAFELGAWDVLTKPFNSRLIIRRISNIVSMRKATELETEARRLKELRNRLEHDTLTGLPTREAFFPKVEALLRAFAPGHFLVVSFDIDGFRIINDQYGTECGDEALRHVAKIFSQGIQAIGGLCCRVAADRFAAVYPRESIATAQNALAQASTLAWMGHPITFSVGYYVARDFTLSASGMYDRASLAKATVKGRYDIHSAVYEERMRNRVLEEQEIINDTAAALQENQFEIWLQPQFNHDTGALIGAEALSRWRHPQKGLVMPAKFIPVFERNGFIYELDRYTWEKTCIMLRDWLNKGRTPLPISVNISRKDIYHPDFYETVVGLVERYQIPPQLLRLEITESAFVQSPEQIISELKRLRDYGFFIEIDDFGSGYSSLNTLKDAPVDMLKMDMRFLERTANAERGGNIVESVVRMAKWIGISVIAEGVETLAQADYLKSIGCAYIQGYLYAKPLPVVEYEALTEQVPSEHQISGLETVQGLDNLSFWNPASMETLIFNSYVGGACILEAFHGRVEVLRVNGKLARLLLHEPYTTSDILTLRLSQHVDAEAAAQFQDCILLADQTGTETVCDLQMTDLPGKTDAVYLHITLRVIARTGERRLVYCMAEDVTAQKLAEAQSQVAARQLQSLMEKKEQENSALLALMNDAPVGFVRMRANANGGLVPVFVNDTFCDLVKMTREQVDVLYGQDAYAGVHPEDVFLTSEAINAVISKREALSVDVRFLHGSDGYIPLHVFYRVTTDADGGVYLNGYYADLRNQREEFQLQQKLLDSLPCGAAIFELADGRINCHYLNQKYAELVGRDGNQLRQDSVTEAIHPDDLPGLYAAIQTGLSDGSDTIRCRIRVQHGNGGYVAFHVTGHLFTREKRNHLVLASYAPAEAENPVSAD